MVGLGPEVLLYHSSDLALPPPLVPLLHPYDLQAAVVFLLEGRRRSVTAAAAAAEVPQAAALRKHALAQGVDVAVGRLPEAEDGLGVGDAH